MKIIVDGFGGDNAPQEIVAGICKALNENEDFGIVVTGEREKLEAELSKHSYPKDRLEIVSTTSVVTNDDVPTEAIRKKSDSSLVTALKMLKEREDINAFVSAGSTGAVLAGALMKVGRIKGISRPALCPVLPTMKADKSVLLVDCGANADCKPINLCHFAIMGSCYHKAAFGTKSPRVALLSNGAEDSKGNELNKEVFPMLKEMPGLNFCGNLEARDILPGEVDVVVCDGFSGNIALKSLEGAITSLLKMLKSEIMSTTRGKVGGLLLKPAFKKLQKTLDYNANGGAVFIGAQKVIVKSHGSSKAQSIACSIIQAKTAAEKNLTQSIQQGLIESGEALKKLSAIKDE